MPWAETGVLTAFAGDPDGSLSVQWSLDGGHTVALPQDQAVGPTLIEEAHRQGLKVFTWTVDDPQRLIRLRDWGIDGVITNDPASARRVWA